MDEELRRAHREVDRDDPESVKRFFRIALRAGDYGAAALARVHAWVRSQEAGIDSESVMNDWDRAWEEMNAQLRASQFTAPIDPETRHSSRLGS